jgi:hypothetical protein
LKLSPQFASVLCALAVLAPAALARGANEPHGSDTWSQTSSGTLAAARNVRIKVDMGSVVVRGGQQPGISYVLRSNSYSSEKESRRQFGSFKISSSVKGDTAWIIGEWEGGRPHKFSGEFVIDVPRETELVKIETGGGGVEATGIAGRVEVQTGGGKIRVDDVGGSVDVETGGDSIEIEIGRASCRERVSVPV